MSAWCMFTAMLSGLCQCSLRLHLLTSAIKFQTVQIHIAFLLITTGLSHQSAWLSMIVLITWDSVRYPGASSPQCLLSIILCTRCSPIESCTMKLLMTTDSHWRWSTQMGCVRAWINESGKMVYRNGLLILLQTKYQDDAGCKTGVDIVSFKW